jgi:DNA invertase Pin-like site-specific DNA recombinase
MSNAAVSQKITPTHLSRRAVVYLRQSSTRQVRENLESQRLQYKLVDRARGLGWKQVEVIDTDLGASASIGAARRVGFDQLVGAVARGEAGIVLSRELSRLSRTDKDWCHLLEVCQLFDT